MLIGSIAGVIVGGVPGLTATLAIALLLPFTYTLSPTVALGLISGIYNGAMFGGAIPAILLRIPGTPGAVATTLDGFPLAQNGKARLALQVSLFSSVLGSVVSAIMLMLLAPPLVALSLRFGPAEYFWVAVFGLSSVALLLSGAPAKGLASALLGVAVGMIGMDMITGTERLVFGFRHMAGGISLPVMLTGMFAIPPALAMISAARTPLGETRIAGPGVTRKELTALWPTWLRSSIIGVVVGIMPGAGGNLASILSYSEERRAARDKSMFGKGDIRGVAASECANNADNASSLIPTLALGVPGNSVAALIMGTLLIQGLNPGPALFRQHADIVYGFMWQMMLTAFIMLIVGLVGAGLFVRILRLPQPILAPMILAICALGTYAATNSFADIWLMYGFGVAAYFLIRAGYPIAPVVLGAILGPLAESSFRQAMLIGRGNPLNLVSSPLSMVLVGLIGLILASQIWRFVSGRLRPQ